MVIFIVNANTASLAIIAEEVIQFSAQKMGGVSVVGFRKKGI